MQQFFRYFTWRLFTAQHVSGILTPIIRSSTTAVAATGFTDHDQQHWYHHAPTVKPEAATAVVELLMMGMRTPKMCWAVNKHQVKYWRNFCIWLVIYVNCMMMHGLTNFKLINFPFSWNMLSKILLHLMVRRFAFCMQLFLLLPLSVFCLFLFGLGYFHPPPPPPPIYLAVYCRIACVSTTLSIPL